MSMSSTPLIQLPPDTACWSRNDTKNWPNLTYEDMVDYLILSKTYDGKEMKSFRALYAYNYVQNGWLKDIFHIKFDNLFFLKAAVSPSQSGVGRLDYNAWVAALPTGEVQTASCSCPAGLGRSCSHVSAIMYAVSLAWRHGMAGETCTDTEVTWGKGSNTKPDEVVNINFSRPNINNNCALISNSFCSSNPEKPPVGLLDHSDLVSFVSQSALSTLWNCEGTMLHKILNAKEVPDLTTFAVNHTTDHTGTNIDELCVLCNSFYCKYVCLSQNSLQHLTEKTAQQNTELWFDSRKLRIPSSKFASVPKTIRADPDVFVTNHLYPRFKGSTATKHGLLSEPRARADLEKHLGCSISISGTVVSKQNPFLSASPDGIIDDKTIVEIKCPTKPPTELISSGKYDVYENNGEYILNSKGKNGYYSQIQIAMYCTQSKLCKFYLWHSAEKIIIDVPFDEEFVHENLPRVRNFYFKHLLVRVVDEFHAKRLKFGKDYISLCN